MKSLTRITTLTILALAATMAFAQTTPTGITIGTYGGAMGVCFSSVCNAGSVSVQSLAITSAFSVEATQYIVPGAGMQGYYGGVSYALPLASLFAKTQLPANTFRVSLHGAPGVTVNSAPGSTAKFGAFGGTEIDIAPTGDGKFVFGPRVDAVYAPGISKTGPLGVAYSLNIGYLFGGTTVGTTAVAGFRTTVRRVWGTKH